MTGADVKRATIHDTLTEAVNIGRAIEAGRRTGDAAGALVQYLSASKIYGHGRELFDGKIVDLRRETTGGFSIGHCKINSIENPSRTLDLNFQNENLAAKEGETVLAIVPDLITVIDRETAEPIPTEALRYGQRVKVIAAAAPKLLRTEAALKFIHPRCFGLDEDYTPIESLPMPKSGTGPEN